MSSQPYRLYYDRMTSAFVPHVMLEEMGVDYELVHIDTGVDAHETDRLGKLALTDDGLRRRDTAVIGHFRRGGVPVCGVIGGGYSTDVPALAERHAILFEVAAEFADAGAAEPVSA